MLIEKDGEIVTVTLNNPEKLNAITDKMRRSLALVTDEIAKDDKLRVVIVTGAGRGFCSGADVGGQAARIDGKTPEVSRHARFQTTGWPYADVFPKLNKQVIAGINGACVGARLSLALS